VTWDGWCDPVEPRKLGTNSESLRERVTNDETPRTCWDCVRWIGKASNLEARNPEGGCGGGGVCFKAELQVFRFGLTRMKLHNPGSFARSCLICGELSQ